MSEEAETIRFVDMYDQPMSVDAWGELFENIEARTLHRLVCNDVHELCLIWTGHLMPELGELPWGLVRRHNGTFVEEIGTYPNRASAERAWIERVVPFINEYTDSPKRDG